MVAVAPGRQGLQQVSNLLPGRQGPPQVSSLLPDKPGHLQVSSLLPDKPDLPQVSSPPSRTGHPIIIPGRGRQVQATQPEIITPGARGNKGHKDTSRAGHSTNRAGLRNLPVRHHRPGQEAVVPREVQEEGRFLVLSLTVQAQSKITFRLGLGSFVEKGHRAGICTVPAS